MNKNTKLIWKSIDELIPYEHNAKEHNETQIKNLATSIEKYGWQNPVLIDKNNVIIAGHGRVLGAQELGLTECPCIYADDLSDEQVREYRLIDNKLNESAWSIIAGQENLDKLREIAPFPIPLTENN